VIGRVWGGGTTTILFLA